MFKKLGPRTSNILFGLATLDVCFLLSIGEAAENRDRDESIRCGDDQIPLDGNAKDLPIKSRFSQSLKATATGLEYYASSVWQYGSSERRDVSGYKTLVENLVYHPLWVFASWSQHGSDFVELGMSSSQVGFLGTHSSDEDSLRHIIDDWLLCGDFAVVVRKLTEKWQPIWPLGTSLYLQL